MEQEILQKATLWQEHIDEPELQAELQQLISEKDTNPQALTDAFYQNLAFGTAGLRGILGVGTNRMNTYTVAQATQGLATYLNAHASHRPTVVLVRDSRNKGEAFITCAASVLAANNIHAIVAPRIEPVPVLSFATRHLHADAGVVITASHNPAPYNGYKAYGPEGGQIANEAAAEIQAAINNTDIFNGVRHMSFEEGLEKGLITYLPDSVITAYLDAIQSVSVPNTVPEDGTFSVVYTPLNGSGLECVEAILARVGIDNVSVVPEQKEPNGDFPTCPYPNPEIREALTKGLELCDVVKPDLLLATDPDADRVGIAVPHKGGYELLTGNEVGTLLIDWLCQLKAQAKEDVSRKVVVSTIVSSDMPNALAEHYGFEIRRVLTGFKYIGEQIDQLATKHEEDRFLLGFEESYGYLAGTHARDKDAVVASMLICEMSAWYAKQGIDLYQAMQNLYETYGYFINGVVNVVFEGASGSQKMADIMERLRDHAPSHIAGYTVLKTRDYQKSLPMAQLNQKPGDPDSTLPQANVLEYVLEGNNKVIIRPSGTEPKIKAYLFAYGKTREEADQIIEKLGESVKQELFV